MNQEELFLLSLRPRLTSINNDARHMIDNIQLDERQGIVDLLLYETILKCMNNDVYGIKLICEAGI